MLKRAEMSLNKTAVAGCAGALLLGCQSTPTESPNAAADPNLLGFLDRQPVTRSDVLVQLGAPSAMFEESRVLTYRIAQTRHGFSVANKKYPSDGWKGVSYCLVLAFDETGALRQHTLIGVRTPPDAY